MKQEIAWTSATGSDNAVKDLMRQIQASHDSAILVMFFASVSYDFQEISRLIKAEFPNSEVVGASTSGEISANGFTKNSIVLTTMIDTQTTVKGVMIPEGAKYPLIRKNEILNAMRHCGITPGKNGSHPDSFAITFINGLCNAEECILSVLYSIVGDDAFRVIGGSCGDDLQFKVTYASLNGEIVTDGGVVVFVKTAHRFVIEKENIFKPTGREVTLTNVDTDARKLISINNKPATTEYAQCAGISEGNIANASLMNPLGRILGNQIFISSIAGVNPDKSFSMYCRVLNNTRVDILELDNVKEIMDTTCDKIEASIKRPGFVFFINCILRTLAFEKTDEGRYLVNLYSKRFDKVAGFSSYGEQIDRINSNQTLVVLAMEE